MTDFSIATRLREIASDTRKLARTRRHKDGKDVSTELEEMAAKLNEIVTELDQPSAGTSAYTMLAEVERANLDVTETLIHMTAATVLAKLIADEGGGRANIEFSPKDMDDMHQRYEIDAKRDGMLTTIKLVPRAGAFADNGDAIVKEGESGYVAPNEDQPEPPVSFYRNPGNLDLENPAEDQVEREAKLRPLWSARIGGKMFPASDRDQAEMMVRHAADDSLPTVENRFCYHKDCPAEHCNRVKTEVASKI